MVRINVILNIQLNDKVFFLGGPGPPRLVGKPAFRCDWTVKLNISELGGINLVSYEELAHGHQIIDEGLEIGIKRKRGRESTTPPSITPS